MEDKIWLKIGQSCLDSS